MFFHFSKNMLQFNIHAPRRYIIDKKDVHVIMGKQQSYFGVHKTLIRPDIDRVCTKTCLLSFSTSNHANLFVTHMKNLQENRVSVTHRDIVDDSILLEVPLEKKVPLSVTSCSKTYLEYLCILHHFDMYLVYNVRKLRSRSTLDLDCLEYNTANYPDTWIQKQMLEGILTL